MWTGSGSVETVPSPNSHTHAVGFPEEASVNPAANGASPDVAFTVKSAAGITASRTVM
ncbi:hypothetical protein DSECCO2_663640 [anaerobic digester metagenome]